MSSLSSNNYYPYGWSRNWGYDNDNSNNDSSSNNRNDSNSTTSSIRIPLSSSFISKLEKMVLSL